MESGNNVVDADKVDEDDTDEDDDSGVESTSVHSLYHSSQGMSVNTLSQDDDDRSLTGSFGRACAQLYMWPQLCSSPDSSGIDQLPFGSHCVHI